MKRIYATALALAVLSIGASAQDPGNGHVEDLAGPRVGVTALMGGITDKLKKDHGIDVAPLITQFGWQTETRFASQPDGFTGVTEVVVLVGGMEQGQFLPSASWLVGIRTAEGFEFGVGPNVTPISLSLAFVMGVTNKVGALNVPINLAVVPSSSGVRISVLTGFNLGR
jgi:hypothetical protein